MIDKIVGAASGIGSLTKPDEKVWDSKESFGQILVDMIKDTNQLMLDSDKALTDFAAGKIDNIHDVMIASEEASLSFQMTMTVRNKVIEAYQEIMRMQV